MIGQRIRLVRNFLGMTQQELADRAGVTQSAISYLEQSGSVTDETLNGISLATGYAVNFFRRGTMPNLPDWSLKYRNRAAWPKSEDRRARAYCRQVFRVGCRPRAGCPVPAYSCRSDAIPRYPR